MEPVAAVWKEHYEPLYRFIRSRVNKPEEAEDLLQDVFLRLHNRLNTLRDKGKLQTRVYQIARNAIVDYYRSRHRLSGLSDTLDIEDPEVEDEVFSEVAGWLKSMTKSLDEPYQEAVLLSEIEGKTHQDVADLQGISLSAAKLRVRRGKLKLKKALLDCCRFTFDQRGRVMDYKSKSDDCCDTC